MKNAINNNQLLETADTVLLMKWVDEGNNKYKNKNIKHCFVSYLSKSAISQI